MLLLLGSLLILVGAAFMLVAAVGVLRMPDLFLRASATTKAATLGGGLILAGAALHFNALGPSSRAVATFVFVLLTTPVAAHLLGRAAFRLRVPLWEGTIVDESVVQALRAEPGADTAPPLSASVRDGLNTGG